jgi:hypothetical protein
VGYQHSCTYRFFLLLFLLCAFVTNAQEKPSAQEAYVPPNVPNTLEGLQSQVDELIRVGKTHDQATWQIALNAFALQDSNAWIRANFAQPQIEQLAQDYAKVRDGHLGHISWVLGHFVDSPSFAIRVEMSEMPTPLMDVGFESAIPRPLQPMSLQNYRFTATNASGYPTPSWVSSYIYVDGHFRVVGGTHPFWAESLTPTRGPMNIPPAQVRGMTVQGAAFRHDQVGNGIIAIVQLKIEVGHDGRVFKIKVVSGDDPYVEDAKRYVQEAQFPALSDDPSFAHVEMKWDFEVAFFAPAH